MRSCLVRPGWPCPQACPRMAFMARAGCEHEAHPGSVGTGTSLDPCTAGTCGITATGCFSWMLTLSLTSLIYLILD